MDYSEYCAEYAHEILTGEIRFSKRVTNKFIKIYTDLQPKDFTPEMYKRLKLTMIDFYCLGLNRAKLPEYPAEKIQLSDFILTK